MELKHHEEVIKSMEPEVAGVMEKYLVPVESLWQPSDFLPDSRNAAFTDEVKELQALAREMDYDFWIVLIGDMITEEALPSYESWLMGVKGIEQYSPNIWCEWVRQWSAEENRHGDVLNKYIYLSGRVNMREVEVSTQYLIADGFDLGLDNDPYKNFVYTSFQELATHISHKRVAEIAHKKGNFPLAKMCRTIAGDEMRHHLAYREFVKQILEIDPSGGVNAYAYMMKRKISMPANLLRQSSQNKGDSFAAFSDAAQRIGVYTSHDYIHILKVLNAHWELDKIRAGLTDEAERNRDFILKLPERLQKLAERNKISTEQVKFKWLND